MKKSLPLLAFMAALAIGQNVMAENIKDQKIPFTGFGIGLVASAGQNDLRTNSTPFIMTGTSSSEGRATFSYGHEMAGSWILTGTLDVGLSETTQGVVHGDGPPATHPVTYFTGSKLLSMTIAPGYRVGPSGGVLLYGKVGYAMQRLSMDSTRLNVHTSENVMGSVVGIGASIALSQHLELTSEIEQINFNISSESLPYAPTQTSGSARLTYRF